MLDRPGIRAVDRALSLSVIWGASSSPPHLGLRSLYGCITSERYHRAIRGKMTPNQMNAAIPERRPATEEISGLIERVTFHNDESGFCVLIRFKCCSLPHANNPIKSQGCCGAESSMWDRSDLNEGSRFSQDCFELRRGRGGLTHGGSRLPCRRQNFRHACLAERGLRQLDAHAGAAGRVCPGVAGSFPAHSWWMGKDGDDPHSPRASK